MCFLLFCLKVHGRLLASIKSWKFKNKENKFYRQENKILQFNDKTQVRIVLKRVAEALIYLFGKVK